MSQGEFKKRIQNMSQGLEPWVHEEEQGSSIICPYQYNINLKEVLEIVDEAKKEFLLLWDEGRLPDEIDDLCEYMADNADKVAVWFVKWFGK